MLHRTRLGLAAVAVSLGLLAGSAPAATALPDWRTDRVSRAAADGVRMPKVVDLRYAEHARFDRVVVDIRGLRPGYVIDYTKRLHQEGSGRVVRLPGRQKMFLSLSPAYAHGRRGHSVYDGPRKQAIDLPTLRGVAFLGDFEGSVTFGFGLDGREPFRIFALKKPARIVVDFKH
jgi:hypothetical protein